MLTPKTFYYEYVLCLYLFLQVTLLRSFSWPITSALFLAFLFLKFKLEGFKITFALFIIAHCIVTFFSNIFLQLLILGLLYLTIGTFPVWVCPEPSGPYKVGYREFLPKDDFHLSVYYPTEETTKDAIAHTDNTLTRRNYEGARLFFNIYIPYVVPQIVHEVAFSFFWKQWLGVNKDARLVTLKNGEKFPVIVFTHGIACSRNMYTLFTKEWASKGYIVFCLDHEEEIYCNWKYFEELIESKVPLLKTRVKCVRKVLDTIDDADSLEEMFTSKVPIDKQRVYMAGHSFGGGTAATVAYYDRRITAGVLLLDPFMGPLDKVVMENKLNLPVLSVRTQEYDQIIDIRRDALRFVETNRENMTSGYFKNSFHCTQCDLILYLPKELCLWEMNGDLKNVEHMIEYHRKTFNIFLDGVEKAKKEGGKKSDKELTMEMRKEMEKYWEAIPDKKLGWEFDKECLAR